MSSFLSLDGSKYSRGIRNKLKYIFVFLVASSGFDSEVDWWSSQLSSELSNDFVQSG